MRRRNLLGWLPVVLCSLPLLAMGLCLFSAATMVVESSTVWAQDDEPDVSDDDLPPAEEAEKPAKAKKKSAAKADSSADDAESESLLGWMFGSLGWGYSIVFLGLSFTLVALFVMNILGARRENMLPVAMIEQFEAHLDAKEYQDAYELAKSDESFLAQVLSAGLSKLSRGYQPAIEAMQETGEEENMKLEHRLSYMALIGTISPMVGLLGTVQGMIASFQVIATSTTAPKPSELAAGISTALFTTLVGLFMAIPAIAAYNILRNRIARLVLEAGIVSEDLMSRFSNADTKKKD
ncbi:MAG: MotA/TolQ/ExbB proton channel family protein [Chloroflexota bacterium]|nr:MotA/TolQ/ExbB proton channel family protein [Chloroflexota bacterium]